MKYVLWLLVLPGVLWLMLAPRASAGERSLAEILAEKGVITESEAGEAAKAVPSVEVPEWAKMWKFSGDMRLRYQGQEEEGKTDRHRYRIRFRFGAKAKITDTFSAGFRLASGGSDPRSTNQTLDNFFSTPDIRLDRAWAKWEPVSAFALTGGKFKNPLWQPADLLWDGDINPEGVAAQIAFGPFFANLGLWLLDESGSISADPYMVVIQPGIKAKMGPVYAKLAVAGYLFPNLTDYNVSGDSGWNDVSAGTNTIADDGTLLYDYDSVGVDAEVGFGLGGPVEMAAIFGQYIHNPDPENENTGYLAGVKFGSKKVSKLGDWKVAYMYRSLEKDAWLDIFPDSDFFDGATGVEGHEIIVQIGLAKHVSLGFDYYSAQEIEDSDIDQQLWQIDLVFKF